LELVALKSSTKKARPVVPSPAVPPTSKSAPLDGGQQVWKPAAQQTWKSALRGAGVPPAGWPGILPAGKIATKQEIMNFYACIKVNT
jgi:hypothetical protein